VATVIRLTAGSPEERPSCGIFAQNYGRRAPSTFWDALRITSALSGHQTYFLWAARIFWN